MNIQTAIKEAIKNNAFITRKSLCFGEGITMVKPTNSFDCCIVIVEGDTETGRRQVRCWNPTAGDLMAEDWKVVTE